MPEAKTKRGYAKIAWEDGDGRVEAGQAVELPFETAEDQANYERLVRTGYITEKKSGTASTT